jgi:hypothetical protein
MSESKEDSGLGPTIPESEVDELVPALASRDLSNTARRTSGLGPSKSGSDFHFFIPSPTTTTTLTSSSHRSDREAPGVQVTSSRDPAATPLEELQTNTQTNAHDSRASSERLKVIEPVADAFSSTTRWSCKDFASSNCLSIQSSCSSALSTSEGEEPTSIADETATDEEPSNQVRKQRTPLHQALQHYSRFLETRSFPGKTPSRNPPRELENLPVFLQTLRSPLQDLFLQLSASSKKT